MADQILEHEHEAMTRAAGEFSSALDDLDKYVKPVRDDHDVLEWHSDDGAADKYRELFQQWLSLFGNICVSLETMAEALGANARDYADNEQWAVQTVQSIGAPNDYTPAQQALLGQSGTSLMAAKYNPATNGTSIASTPFGGTTQSDASGITGTVFTGTTQSDVSGVAGTPGIALGQAPVLGLAPGTVLGQAPGTVLGQAGTPGIALGQAGTPDTVLGQAQDSVVYAVKGEPAQDMGKVVPLQPREKLEFVTKVVDAP